MDKEKAKFILQSFRPDGSDAADPAFAEALALASSDKELGAWLARERTADSAFAAALNEVEIPENLRSSIFEVLGLADSGEMDDLGFDADFIGALASVRPPEGLRDQILNAMDVEQKVIRPNKAWGWSKISSIGAVAAAVVLGLFLTFGTGGRAIANTTTEQVHSTAIAMLSAPLFSLDLQEENQVQIYEWLQSEQLPAPEALPVGLRDLEGVGCKHLTIGESESKGSLICYRKSDGTIVHLIMMEKKDFGGELEGLEQADELCQPRDGGDWAVTQWADADHAFFLVSKMATKELSSLF